VGAFEADDAAGATGEFVVAGVGAGDGVLGGAIVGGTYAGAGWAPPEYNHGPFSGEFGSNGLLLEFDMQSGERSFLQ